MWLETLRWIVFVSAIVPVSWLLLQGATALVTADFGKDAWLQSAANIVGSALSGGVAAAVAIWILNREQRERDRERETAARNTIGVIDAWISSLTEKIEREAIETAKTFPRNDQNLIVATLKVLEGLHLPPAMQAQIYQTHPKLFPEILNISDLLKRFEHPLIRSGKTQQYGRDTRYISYTNPLDMNDIRTIATLPDEFGMAILSFAKIEPALSERCQSAAHRLFRATDGSVSVAEKENGVEFDHKFEAVRPSWYRPI